MAPYVMTDCTAWIDGLALTTYANEMTLSSSVDDKDVTTFGSGGWKARTGGLRDVDFSLKGFWESTPDADTWSNLGTADRALTVTPTGAAGSVAYFCRVDEFSYEQGGGVGDVEPFSLKAMGSNAFGAIRGQLAAAKGNVAATGALGSAVNLGAPSATQFVYAVLHVFTAATTITVQVQSDDNSGMSSPTTRGTIGPITVAGGTWMTRVAGPFSGETWWRMNVSAISGTFNVAGAIGIQ